MSKHTMLVTMTLPGTVANVVEVEGATEVTIELPVQETGPLTTETARNALTKGLSDFDADILLERIRHFATTESIRARIKVGSLVERSVG